MKKLWMIVLMGVLLVGTIAGQEWVALPSDDLLTGVKGYNVFCIAETSEGTIKDAALGFKLRGDELEIMVLWGGYAMDVRKNALVRFGSDVAVPWPVVDITHDGSALFMGNVSGFMAKLKSMSPSDAIIIQSTRSIGSKSTARWYVGNLHTVAKGALPGW